MKRDNGSDLLPMAKRLLLDSGVVAGVYLLLRLADNLFSLFPPSSHSPGLPRHFEVLSRIENATLDIALPFVAMFVLIEMAPLAIRVWRHVRKS